MEVIIIHSYMRAIGFSEIRNRKELEPIIKNVIDDYDDKKVISKEDGNTFIEISKLYSDSLGITVCGEPTADGTEVIEEYYFPFYLGMGVSTREEIIVEKKINSDTYCGACDDVRIGITLIFHIQNISQCISELERVDSKKIGTSVTFSGLSIEGTILLPILKDTVQLKENKKDSDIRKTLLSAARKGDEDAMESLTINDLDTYTMISKRIREEDVFSIVETYCMPYGMECDLYNIMGEIRSYAMEKNVITGENICVMTVSCNDLVFDLSINQMDLVGIPEIGRRFKGVVWLQGAINFSRNREMKY
jgi:hypothetical protein